MALVTRAFMGAMMARVKSLGFDGLTPAFASVMPLLDANGARSTVLAQKAGVTKQAMSQLIRLLETRGYVEQVPDLQDTRAKVVRLTKSGVRLRAACFQVRQELSVLALKTFGEKRLARMHGDLVQLQVVLAQLLETTKLAAKPKAKKRAANRSK
jgi:DNA-binding MarR family transcriptional regulator